MSEEPAETLAWDALTQSTSYRTPSGSINMVDPTAAGLAISKEQHQVSRTPTLDCNHQSCPSSFMLLPLPTWSQECLPYLFQDDVEDASLEDVSTQSSSQNYTPSQDGLPRNIDLEMMADGPERAFNTQ